MGLPYETVHIPNRPEFLRSDEFRSLNPSGKIPAIDDDGLILFESVAIMQYLLAKPGGKALAPQPGDPTYGPFLQWLHFGEAGMGSYVTLALGHRSLLPEEKRVEAIARYAENEAKRCFETLRGPLKNHDYLLPQGFSAADISVAYMLLLAKFARIFDQAPDEVKGYFARCSEREGWKIATAD
jgi:glutathione S-transferase